MRVFKAFWVIVSLFAFAFAVPAHAQSCTPRDFTTLSISTNTTPDWIAAILLAFPDLRYDATRSMLIDANGAQIFVEGPTGRATADILPRATLGDQFAIAYPLSRDLSSRLVPWYDPGRARHGAFFAFLYGSDRADVSTNLVAVAAGQGTGTVFRVNRRRGVACQLQAAMQALQNDADRLAPYFKNVGGSFNWRRIAGTERLSAHSYGIAIDINVDLGGYWRWSGATEGQVGLYNNKIPWSLVETMERFGFIWGGKWHHFDGMHFEYRPELILFSRLQGGVVSPLRED